MESETYIERIQGLPVGDNTATHHMLESLQQQAAAFNTAAAEAPVEVDEWSSGAMPSEMNMSVATSFLPAFRPPPHLMAEAARSSETTDLEQDEVIATRRWRFK
jgi:hypothetical protein